MSFTNPYVTHQKDRRKTHKLWERFQVGLVTEESLGQYENTLVREWQRCKTLGIDAEMRAGILLSEDQYNATVENNRLLLVKSKPILNKISKLLSGVPGILMLTDRMGTILNIVGSPAVRLRAADESNIVEGSSWVEALAGTNGIGTVIARKEPVHVYSSEHFCEGWHRWACAGAPIFDPFTEDILGVIEFTTMDKDYREDAVGLTYSLSGQIWAELRLQLELERMQLVRRYSDYSSRYPSDGIVVVDRMGRIVRSSPDIDLDGYDLSMQSLGDKEQPKKVQQIYLPDDETEIGSLLVVRRPPRTSISVPAESDNSHCVSEFGEFVTASGKLKGIMERVRKVSPLNINVLLIGETGTGKELIANYIHMHSPRESGPLVAVNCGAVSKELLESKFFGYERGAFTGADPRGRKGFFECANGGTLFLDEVGELPLDIQAAFLRVLETGHFHRVGSDKEMTTDCRIIAATNRPLLEEIESGAFRADLFYRLGVAKLEIPPLRERPEDIPVIIQRIMESLCRKHEMAPLTITPEAMEILCRYSWPGNGREVRNVIESAMICAGDSITVQDLPIEINNPHEPSPQACRKTDESPASVQDNGATPTDYRISPHISQQESHLIISALTKHKNISLASKALGVSRATFYRKCKAHEIKPTDYI
jgi:transcriptional regulator of acetoin/glycerol metabolism